MENNNILNFKHAVEMATANAQQAVELVTLATNHPTTVINSAEESLTILKDTIVSLTEHIEIDLNLTSMREEIAHIVCMDGCVGTALSLRNTPYRIEDAIRDYIRVMNCFTGEELKTNSLHYLLGEDKDGNPINSEGVFTVLFRSIIHIIHVTEERLKQWFIFNTNPAKNIFTALGTSLATAMLTHYTPTCPPLVYVSPIGEQYYTLLQQTHESRRGDAIPLLSHEDLGIFNGTPEELDALLSDEE